VHAIIRDRLVTRRAPAPKPSQGRPRPAPRAVWTVVGEGFASVAVQRFFKATLVGGVALYFTLVALGNLSDYQANYAFVQHVLSMDTTFPNGVLRWRAVHSPVLWNGFYLGIIAWEISAALLLWLSAGKLASQARGPASTTYAAARRFASNALVFGILLWLLAFITIGGEWFQMWQSRQWNGLPAALQNVTIQGLILIYLNLGE
jgi:predicted small integral membrane protein